MKKTIITLLTVVAIMAIGMVDVQAATKKEEREWPENWDICWAKETDECAYYGFAMYDKKTDKNIIIDEETFGEFFNYCFAGDDPWGELVARNTDPYYYVDKYWRDIDKKAKEMEREGNGVWNNKENAEFGVHKDKTNVKNNFRVVELTKKVEVYSDKKCTDYLGKAGKGALLIVDTPNSECEITGKVLKIRLTKKKWGYVKNTKNLYKKPSKIAGEENVRDYVTTCATALYDKPNGKKICSLKQGTELKLVDYSRYRFYKVSYGDKVGYVKRGHVDMKDSLNVRMLREKKIMYILYNKVPLYKEYKRDSEVVCELKAGSKVKLLSRVDCAWKVEYKGKVGYVDGSWITKCEHLGYEKPTDITEDEILSFAQHKYQYDKLLSNEAGYNTLEFGTGQWEYAMRYVSPKGVFYGETVSLRYLHGLEQ